MASARPITDARRLELVRAVAGALGLRQAPRLWSSSGVAIPIAWGIRRAHIVLPAHQDAWSDERLRAVLAHEMAHIRRRDWLTHLLAELACAIYWFHPLMWLGRNRLRHESELAADDEVLGLGADAADYAAHLLAIVRAAGRRTVRATPTMAMARASDLEQRVVALLSKAANRASVTPWRLMAALVTVSAVVLPLAAVGAGIGTSIELRTTVLPPAGDAAGLELTGPTSDPVKQVRALPGTNLARAILPAVTEYTTPPLYSDEARQRGIEGIVTVRAHVDGSGRVSETQVVAGPGFGLDQNALVALRQWRFTPGVVGGTPTPMTVEIDIEFTLRNEAVNALIANDMVSLVGPEVTAPRVVRAQGLRPYGVNARGTVVLDVIVLESGTPRIVRVLQSLGPAADEIAVRTLEQWRFSPAMRDGQPLKVRMKAEVSFHG
jgi:TonB family protein